MKEEGDSGAPIAHGWHIKKDIEISQIFTILVVAVSIALYISRIEQRVAILEAQAVTQKDNNSFFLEQLDKIDKKLDRLIERMPNRGPTTDGAPR